MKSSFLAINLVSLIVISSVAYAEHPKYFQALELCGGGVPSKDTPTFEQVEEVLGFIELEKYEKILYWRNGSAVSPIRILVGRGRSLSSGSHREILIYRDQEGNFNKAQEYINGCVD